MPASHAKSAGVMPKPKASAPSKVSTPVVKEIEAKASAPALKVPVAVELTGTPAARFEALLVRVGAKSRVNIEKHLALCDAEPTPGHGKLWRRLALKLGELAPMPVQIAGPQAIQFFVADGKYRQQVFALEDLRDGKLSVYLPDVLSDAVSAKLLKKAAGGYLTNGAKKEPLVFEAIDSANMPDPAAHVKHMIGWNRKAIKITIDTNESYETQTAALESLCELAAKRWQTAAK
jgi:hypothetical protein